MAGNSDAAPNVHRLDTPLSGSSTDALGMKSEPLPDESGIIERVGDYALMLRIIV